MPVALISRQRRFGVRAAEVRADAVRLLRALGVDAELSVALVGDTEIHRLNLQYRHVDKPTDVLAFPLEAPPPAGPHPLSPSPLPELTAAEVQAGGAAGREGKGLEQGPAAPRLLGDVVISLDTAVRQAAERGVPVADEVRTLLIHGLLHLLGYDHERSSAEARRMFRKQRQLVTLLKN